MPEGTRIFENLVGPARRPPVRPRRRRDGRLRQPRRPPVDRVLNDVPPAVGGISFGPGCQHGLHSAGRGGQVLTVAEAVERQGITAAAVRRVSKSMGTTRWA